MEHNSIQVVMYVIYGYTVWIAAEYLWDWYQKRFKGKELLERELRDREGTESSTKTSANDEDRPKAA
jgi:hypothetical protein